MTDGPRLSILILATCSCFSTRVNKPENDDASILDRVDQPVGIIAK
jgi:hypothetical protein